MKKIIIILVLFVYSAATIGATVHLHYCMNQFAGWSLWQAENDNECSTCGMTGKQGGCCKDEHKQIKIKGDYQKSNVAQYIHLISAPALVTPFPTYSFRTSTLPYYTPRSNAPPLISKRLHLLNCVFLI